MTTLIHFNRDEKWMVDQIRKIGRERFSSEYWDALDSAIQDSLQEFSFVIKTTERNAIAAFVLVCSHDSESAESYQVNLAPFHEIAFIATDSGWEGKGFARRMLLEVLLCCKATHQGCWLHVDLVNSRARGLYESIGFIRYLTGPDPYGSLGWYMLYVEGGRNTLHFEGGRNTSIKKWTALFDAPQSEAEEAFRGRIVLPPLIASV
jgi:ribosomal protein S18 acetylase RimI-like enzyme